MHQYPYQSIIVIPLLGKVGIALNGEWSEPLDPNDESHVEAAERNLQFTVGWFAHPIFKNGSYPPVMRERVCLVKNSILSVHSTLNLTQH